MSWVSKFFQNRAWLGITQYNSTTGLFYVNGTAVTGVSSYTWAQFIDAAFDLTVARHIVVSDKHSSTTGYGGSLWYVDPTAPVGYKRQLRSSPIRATWATRLDAATYPGIRHYFTDIGDNGSYWFSNGTRFKIDGGGSCVLKGLTDQALASAYVEQIMATITLPTDATKNCMQNGDYITIKQVLTKTGSADNLGRIWRMGNVSTTSAAVAFSASPSVGSLVLAERLEIKRLSATSVRIVGSTSGNTAYGGNIAASLLADKTGLDNMDTSSAYYFLSCFKLISVGGTDTNPKMTDFEISLTTAGV